MKYFVTLNGRTREVMVEGDLVQVDGRRFAAELRPVAGTPLRVLALDGVSWQLAMENAGRGAWIVQAGGERHEVAALDERAAHIRALVGQGAAPPGPPVLKAPMPGLVVRVLVESGQKVLEGTSLIVLEAMKMENELKAVSQGTVEAVSVSRGQTVEKGQVLLRFTAAN